MNTSVYIQATCEEQDVLDITSSTWNFQNKPSIVKIFYHRFKKMFFYF